LLKKWKGLSDKNKKRLLKESPLQKSNLISFQFELFAKVQKKHKKQTIFFYK
jgi:hypothetical protein